MRYKGGPEIFRGVHRFSVIILLGSAFWPGFEVGAQQVVSAISIEGNRVTKEYIIRREIQHPLEGQLDSTIVEEDRDRIDNLSIFSSVKWRVELLEDDTVELIYTVVEIWRIWPAVAPIYSEEQGWSIIGAVRFMNFRGRNQSLFAARGAGEEEGYFFFFQDPWIAGDHISFSSGVSSESSTHPFLPYNQVLDMIGIGIGMWFDYRWQIDAGFSLDNMRFTGEVDTLEYSYIQPTASIVYDTRDLYRDPSKGLKISQDLKAMFNFSSSDQNQLVWSQSIGTYWSPIKGDKKLTLGFGAGLITTFGSLDEVWLNYIGGSKTVRGWSPPSLLEYSNPQNTFRFGHQQLIMSVEARQTIIPSTSISVLSFSSEIGLTGVGFIDMGYSSKELSDLFHNDPLIGVGFGIRLPTPIGFILRMDYGWGFYGGTEMGTAINLGAGQKF